jgi:hypothetical protein
LAVEDVRVQLCSVFSTTLWKVKKFSEETKDSLDPSNHVASFKGFMQHFKMVIVLFIPDTVSDVERKNLGEVQCEVLKQPETHHVTLL